MNTMHDYRALRDEFVASDTQTIRGLARDHGIKNHSPINDRAKKEDWVGLRAQRQGKADTRMQDALALDEARRRVKAVKVVDRAFDVIERAFDRMIEDMNATKPVLYAKLGPNGSDLIREEPIYRMKPNDFATLVDKMNVLLGRPGVINEERTLGISLGNGDVPIDLLKDIVAVSRGLAGSGAMGGSAIPRIEGTGEAAER